MRKLVLWGLVLAACFSAARAEEPAASPELKAFLMRPDQQQIMGGMMLQHWRLAVGDCPAPQITQLTVSVALPPVFDREGVPVSGKWRVAARVEGCKESRQFNILYDRGAGDKMVRLMLLPGTTVADMLLQKDALAYATTGMAKLAPKGCKDVRVTDTKFLAFGEAAPSAVPGRNARSWTEAWTVKACGVTGLVTLHFVPDATGTVIFVEPEKTRSLAANPGA